MAPKKNNLKITNIPSVSFILLNLSTAVFHLRRRPCAKLMLYLINQRVLFGVLGLPISECLDVGPLFMVLVHLSKGRLTTQMTLWLLK